MSITVKIDSEKSFKKGLDKAVKILSQGGIVGFPTESFYGLAVDAVNPVAIKKLFKIKKRDPSHPILILISSTKELPEYVSSMSPAAKEMGEKFWPGGLTMVFHPSPVLPAVLTGDTGKIGIRVSSHPIGNALPRILSHPVTGTSANISGQPPCTLADQVADCIGDYLDLILDGGETEGIAPSTILDMTKNPPVIIRKGIVKRESMIESGICNEIITI